MNWACPAPLSRAKILIAGVLATFQQSARTLTGQGSGGQWRSPSMKACASGDGRMGVFRSV
jgi:hypothetical protein